MNKTKKMSKEAYSRIYSLPIIPFLKTAGEWEAYIGQEADPVISFLFRKRPVQILEDGRRQWEAAPDRQKEGFALREQFFAIKSAEDALRFFQEFGPYQLPQLWDATAQPIKLSQVLSRRDYYLDGLLHRSIENIARKYSGDEVGEGLDNIFLWQNLPMELVFRQPMSALVRCKDIEESLRATVFLDRLWGMPWKQCKREDCGKPFEVKTAREKLYCSTECAHLSAVRTYNKAKQTAKAAKPVAKKGKA